MTRIPLKHLKKMTTNIGLVQHACASSPDLRFGYSLDDNARALLVSTGIQGGRENNRILELTEKYLSFIARSVEGNILHNFLDRDGQFVDEIGSEDSFGRTIWALGSVKKNCTQPEYLRVADNILEKVIVNVPSFKALRAKAFSLIGLVLLGEYFVAGKLAEDLIAGYKANSDCLWHWFEDELTYSNAIFPYSLLILFKSIPDKRYFEMGIESLNFLDQSCRIDGIPAPIGQRNWFKRGGKRSVYDQQLIDAADMVLAAKVAYSLTSDKRYAQMADDWIRWFHGVNINRISLFDAKTEGCYDALTKGGVNLNQGAESILAYLLALTETSNS